jgi:hypothetical protein
MIVLYMRQYYHFTIIGGTFQAGIDFSTVILARGCFGVGVIKRFLGDGQYEGVRPEPFDYTGRTVVADKAYQLAKEVKYNRVLPLKCVWTRDGYGYRERYGDNWETE